METAIQFQIDPAFVSMLKQQPTNSSALYTELEAIRAVFMQQEAALSSGNDIGIPVLPTVKETDRILAALQERAGEWNRRLQAGLNDIIIDFQSFCQLVDKQSELAAIQAAWRTSVSTAQTVDGDLKQLSNQVINMYLQLPNQERELSSLAQSVAGQVKASEMQMQLIQSDINGQLGKIDDIKHDESIASIFVGHNIADGLGNLITGMNSMKDNLNDLIQRADVQAGVAAGLNQYSSALGNLLTKLQTFTQNYVAVSMHWSALSADMGNFDDAITNRIHTDSLFFVPQVKAAADDLNTVLSLYAVTSAA